MILYFIFEHFTVLKQIHTLGPLRVFEHFTGLEQTQTGRDFVTFLRFDLIINNGH